MGRAMRHSKRGFTLIEMLIVLALIALLLTIALPRYLGSLDHSKEVALKEDLKVLRLTLDKYYADKGHYPTTLDELIDQKYLRNVPIDPMTDSPQTWILVSSKDSDVKGIIDIKSGAVGIDKSGQSYESL